MQINDLVKTWNILIRFRIRTGEQDVDNPDPGQLNTLLFFPVIGLAVGIAGLLVAEFLRVLSNSSAAAGLIGAVGVPALIWWLYQWRGLRGLHSVFGPSLLERASPENGGPHPLSRFFYTMLLLQFLLLVKCVCIGLLIYTGQTAWIVVAAVLGAAGYAHAVQQTEPAHGVKSDEHNQTATTAQQTVHMHAHWLVAGGLALVFGGVHYQLFEALLVAVLVWLAAPMIGRIVREQSGNGATYRDLTMEAGELVALVCSAFLVLP